ncbi:MAG: magnesium protoporphyrin IX methyltransferase [Granulosicoccus sp.]
MQRDTYLDRRQQLKTYFDRTAAHAWEQLTSEAPVSRIRQTVRAGRAEMFDVLLSWMPDDLSGKRVLDAGCGTGAFSIACARRGAEVVGIDLSPSLIKLAQDRTPSEVRDRLRFRSGDMLGAEKNHFDYVIAIDSLIHYQARDIVRALSQLQQNATGANSRLLFTFAPRSPALMIMKSAGKLFPRNDRSPAIEPVKESLLRKLVASELPDGTDVLQTQRVNTPFYKSQAMELSCP